HGRAGAADQPPHLRQGRVDGVERVPVGRVIDTGHALVLPQVDGQNGAGGGRGFRSGRRHGSSSVGRRAWGRVVTPHYHPTACISSFGGGGQSRQAGRTTGGRVHIGRLPMDRRRVLAVLGAALAGAARGPTDEAKRSPAEPASRSVSRLPAADLRNAADDPKVDRADRAAAVFALFANHLKPPCGSATAGAALGDAGWLASANLYEVRTVMGMIPVEFGGGATVFCLLVLPIKD